MATPVTDLEQRLREADFTEAQARAIATAFEALRTEILDVERRLSERIDAVERRLDRHDAMFRIVIAMQLVTIGAVLAPYIGRLFVAG